MNYFKSEICFPSMWELWCLITKGSKFEMISKDLGLFLMVLSDFIYLLVQHVCSVTFNFWQFVQLDRTQKIVKAKWVSTSHVICIVYLWLAMRITICSPVSLMHILLVTKFRISEYSLSIWELLHLHGYEYAKGSITQVNQSYVVHKFLETHWNIPCSSWSAFVGRVTQVKCSCCQSYWRTKNSCMSSSITWSLLFLKKAMSHVWRSTCACFNNEILMITWAKGHQEKVQKRVRKVLKCSKALLDEPWSSLNVAMLYIDCTTVLVLLAVLVQEQD